MYSSKSVGFLVLLAIVSLSLNTYYTWRLSTLVRENHVSSSSTKQEKYSSNNYSEQSLNECQKDIEGTKKLARLIAELNSKLNKIQPVEAVALSNQDQDDLRVRQSSNVENQDSNMESFSQITRMMKRSSSNPPSVEEWFWSQAEDAKESAPFEVEKLHDDLLLESVICRGEWCRVEMEDLRDQVATEAADLDLQLKINGGLGRDTTMVIGDSQGNNRVIYLK